MLQRLLILIVLLSLSIIANSQTVAPSSKTADEEKLEKAAVEFLRETLQDVNNMRSLENRISFTAEMASLMWFHDEREARLMFNGVIEDFRQLVVRYDAQMNFLGTRAEDENGEGGGQLIFDQTERAKIERRFRTALAVRQQIASSMAEHDPDMAFDFYYASLAAISNPEIRQQTENMGRYFEFQLINQIALKDPAKAAKFGSRSLKNGLEYQHLELLKKIYAKDPDRAAEFAADILSTVKSDKMKSREFWVMSSLLYFGAETLEKSRTEGGKKPIYSQSDLRDLAEAFAQAILDRPANEGADGLNYIDQIAKYAPGRAAQIRAKYNAGRDSNPGNSYGANRAAANAMNAVSNIYVASNSANANISPGQKALQEREKNEKQMMDDVTKVGNKELPKDQRDSIIAQARKILMLTPGRDKKVTGLSMLAAQVARAGDKELAGQIMKDAQSLVSPEPRNYKDFLLTWMLASGYASVDPDKAFPLLEDTIGRVNETITAFVKVAEFIDAEEELIQEGEVQVGAFGGNMISGLTRELGMADATIIVLAKADFNKTRDMVNKFERPEVRVLAKMMVLRAVLGDKKSPKAEDPELLSVQDMEDGPPPPRKSPN